MATRKVKFLLGVSHAYPGPSWAPGEVVEMEEEEAAKWADGVRAVYADAPEAAVVEAPEKAVKPRARARRKAE